MLIGLDNFNTTSNGLNQKWYLLSFHFSTDLYFICDIIGCIMTSFISCNWEIESDTSFWHLTWSEENKYCFGIFFDGILPPIIAVLWKKCRSNLAATKFHQLKLMVVLHVRVQVQNTIGIFSQFWLWWWFWIIFSRIKIGSPREQFQQEILYWVARWMMALDDLSLGVNLFRGC